MRLSLDIIVQRWGLRPVGRGDSTHRAATRGTMGPAGICEHGRRTGRIVQEPGRSHAPPREAPERGNRQSSPRPSSASAARWSARANTKRGRHAGLGSKSISDRVSGMGSRSALVGPTTSGNLAHGDPAEERGAPRSRTADGKHGGRFEAHKRVHETAADSRTCEDEPEDGVHLVEPSPRRGMASVRV